MSNKILKCPICNNKYENKNNLYNHLEDKHANILQNMSAAQYYFNYRNKKTHGTCVICGKETTWNEQTEKYNRLCSEKCKQAYVKQFKNRMLDTYGKVHLLNDEEMQMKMLKHRRISGTYTWVNCTGKTDYTGSYELSFLKFLDLNLNWDSNDIIMPSPHTFKYMYNGTEHFYIPDAYIPSLNLIIEIKDGGDNPNKHHKIQDIDKIKEKSKDTVMQNGIYNYVKIVNKQNIDFLEYITLLKDYNIENSDNDKKEPLIVINENSIANIDYGAIITDKKYYVDFDRDIIDNNDNESYIDILSENTAVKAVKRNDYKKNGVTRNINYYLDFLNKNLTENNISNIQQEFKNYRKEKYDTEIIRNTSRLYESLLIYQELSKNKATYIKIKTHDVYIKKYKNVIIELNNKAKSLDTKYHNGAVYKDFQDELDVQLDRVKRLIQQQKRVLKEANESILSLIKNMMKNL